MLKKKYNKIICIIFCIIFLFLSITNGICANNCIHTMHCKVINCPLCAFINISSKFAENLKIVNFDNLSLILIFIMELIIINKNKKEEINYTLIDLKVRQNN